MTPGTSGQAEEEAEGVTVTLSSYQWEAILRGLASSGWDSMHRLLSERLALAASLNPAPSDADDFWEYRTYRRPRWSAPVGEWELMEPAPEATGCSEPS